MYENESNNNKKYGKWNTQIGVPLIGKQLNYNGLLNKFTIIEKLKNPSCWTCSYTKSKEPNILKQD